MRTEVNGVDGCYLASQSLHDECSHRVADITIKECSQKHLRTKTQYRWADSQADTQITVHSSVVFSHQATETDNERPKISTDTDIVPPASRKQCFQTDEKDNMYVE